MDKENKIEINIMGDVYIASTTQSKREVIESGSNYNSRYELEDRMREERHRQTRARFYRANAL